MIDISAVVRELGGMAQKQQLVARGARDIDLTRAVRAGSVTRVRNGWYATLPDDDLGTLAVRVGGRLSGISAVQRWGGWVLGPHPLHVSVPDNAARLRSSRHRSVRMRFPSSEQVIVHWDSAEVSDRGSSVSVGVADALLRVILDEPLELAVAALDWALRTGVIDEVDFAGIIRRLPRALRSISEWVDPSCDSLPESLARTRLRSDGHATASQVGLGDSRRIDLVVDGVVALEIDGARYHGERFEQDRRKDLLITMDGLVALRPSANTVFREWGLVALAVETALAGRLHVPLSEIQENARRRRPPPPKRPVRSRRRLRES